jgi:autotransporter-associated beta strand protein
MSDLTSNGSWSKQGANVFQLGGSNVYSGSTSINNGAIQLINGDDRLPVTTTLNIGQAGSANVGKFDLNGFNQTISGLNSIVGTNLTAAKNTVTTSSFPCTLTINSTGIFTFGAGTTTNSGIISGAITLVKNGLGSQILGDINSYTGSTIINAGELRFSPNASESLNASALIMNGGMLSTTGTSSNVALTFSTLSLNDNSVINLESVNTHTLNFSSSSGITWAALKTLTITGWQGTFNSSGTAGTVGRLFIGSGTNDLTVAQLSQIVFYNGLNYYPATLLATGELVPYCIAPVLNSVSSNTSLCVGANLNLTANATGTYSPMYFWTGPNSFTSNLQNPSINNASGLASGLYTVIASNICGNASSTVSVTINPLPTVVANSTSVTICSGQQITLSGSGANTYTWTNGVINGIAFTPTTSTTYSLTGTDNNTCLSSATIAITVNSTPTLSVNSATICAGNSATIMANGANTYSWSNNVNGSSIVVSPTTTTVYSVTGTSSLCSSINTASVIINPLPIISVPSATVCLGGTATLSASGAVTYTWSDNSNGTSLIASPLANTNYSISGSSLDGCISTVTSNIIITSSPSISVNSQTICSGNSATLQASGVNTYTWNTNANNSAIIVSPTVATVYTVTGKSSGCPVVASNTVSVFVNSLPIITVNSSTICSGTSASLISNGASTYTWSNGSNTSSIVISPSTNTVYLVNGTSSLGCVNSESAQVIVNSLPTISINAPTLCAGSSATLTATGANSYSWSNGSNNTSSITINPAVTQIYSVSGTSSLGCNSTNTVQVTVNLNPTVVVNSPSLCIGTSTLLTANGANTYSWINGPTTATISVSPTINTTYTVIGASNQGCQNTRTVQVTVYSLPTITVNSATICNGQSASLTAIGANTYSWSNTSTNSLIAVSPSTTTSYTVTGTSLLGCTNTISTAINVNQNPTVSVSSSTICTGASATLTAVGASSYSWNTTSNSASIVTTPSTNTNYTVTGFSAQGCSISATASVLVNPLPIISANSATICSGGTGTLLAAGASTYSWNTGSTNNSIVQSPTVNTNYTVTGISAQGCASIATTTIIVTNSPNISVNSTSICAGNSTTLSASGVTTFTWDNGATSSSINVTPSATTIYTVSGNASGCLVIAMSTATVTVNPLPIISINSASVCAGNSASLTASGATSYTWNTGNQSPTLVDTPTSTTVYSVSGISAEGCLNSNTGTITVNALPNVSLAIANTSLCINDNAVNLIGSPAGGLYSGIGVTGNIFNPSIAGVGNFTLSYSYSDLNNCTNTISKIVMVNLCTGLKETIVENPIIVFPNPASNNLIISHSNFSKPYRLSILNLSGQILYDETAKSAVHEINITSFDKGLYFIKLSEGKNVTISKFIKD